MSRLKTNKPGAIIIEGHVQGLSNVRSLGEAGIPVYVIDKADCIARYSGYCKKFFRCPDYISAGFTDFLVELAQKEDLKDWVLIPSNDHAVYSIAKEKKELEKYYRIITPGMHILEKIYDKAKLLDTARLCNVPFPVTQYFKSAGDKISETLHFPVLIKGRNGLTFYKMFHKKAFVAENVEGLRQQLKKLGTVCSMNELFVQELISSGSANRTVSFTAFCVNGSIKTHWSGVKLREHPVRFGTATFAESITAPECYMLSEMLLKELDYTGVCEIEYLFDPATAQYKLIEVNARTWLWVGLAKACGIDYAKIIYSFINGQMTDFPVNYAVGVKWINYVTDTVFSAFEILKGQLGVFSYVKSLKGRKINAVFSFKDLLPGIMFLMLAGKIIRRKR